MMSRPGQRPGPDSMRRLGAVTFFSLMAGLYVLRLRYAHPEQLSDVHQLLIAARAWLNGSNPYEAVRTSTQWPFPLLYPFPAVIVIGPLAGLPAWAADALFATAGTAVLAWA